MVRGWWLITAAAVVTAVLTALGKVYTGAVVAGLVAAGGAVVAVIAERGRAQIAERAKSQPRSPYVCRVDKIDDPVRLRVHPAARLEHADGHVNRVPPFVPRDRMPELEAALRAGGFVLVVGDSAAGKTRLAYEAMRACLPKHVCVKPEEDSAALAAGIVAAKQKRPSVLWLDDLERYLGTGGLTRTDLDELGNGVVVLATLRAHLRDELSARYDPSRAESDRLIARAGREVFDAVSMEIRLGRVWSPAELANARESTDPRIAHAVRAADRHGVAETIAASPELLRDWHDAWSAAPRTPDRTYGDPRGAALVSAAVDVRRAGYHRPLSLDILRELHEVYLREHGGKSLHPGTWENALDWATKPLHATSSLIDPDTYRAFDYLVDETVHDASAPAIPEATWLTLIERLDPDDVVEVAWQASHAGYVQYTEPVFHRALDSGHYHAAAGLAECLDEAGQHSRAAELLELTISRAEGKDGVSDQDVLNMRRSLAWMIGEQVSGHGDPQRALDIIRRVVRHGETLLGTTHPRLLSAKLTLARQLGASGNPEEALAVASDVAALALEHNGSNDELTLDARFEAAVWTRHVHGDAAGVEVFGELLEHAQSVDTVSWPFLIDTAWNLGGALLKSGNAAAAVSVLEQAVTESELAYGRKHARALPVRLSHASAIAAAGDLSTAVELTRELVADSTDTVGEADLTTLQMKAHFAHWTRQAGDRATAVELFESVLADGVRLFGDDHWLVVSVRAELTKLCGIAADRDEG